MSVDVKFNLAKINEVLFQTAAEGLLVVDESGLIVLANPKAEEMFGYSAETLLEMNVDLLIPKSLRNKHKEHREVYSHKPQRRSMGFGFDLEAVNRSGKVFPVEVSLNHFSHEERRYVMCLITDISERKKVERALHALNEELEKRVEERTIELQNSQKLYSLIARNYPNGTINVFDKELNYVFVEGEELYRLGVTSEKLVGTSYLKRLPSGVRETIKEKLNEVFGGTNTTFELFSKGRYYHMNAVGLPDASGRISRVLVVEQNVTKQKVAEQEVQRNLEKEQELNALKSRFVSMASHEFRTPLSAILSSASLLTRYNDQPDKQEKHVGRIKSSVHNLTNILDDFLSLDKLEANMIKPQYSTFDFNALCLQVIDELQLVLRMDQHIEFKSDIDASVYMDRQMLRNILINLLSNASKYSDEGKRIFLTASSSPTGIFIKVKDEGIGIPEKEQQHLFERFFRAYNATNIQGTGLGLNIVKKYVELMGGSIEFESAENKGTIFRVYLAKYTDEENFTD